MSARNALAALAALLALAMAPAAASARVPDGFAGAMFDGPLVDQDFGANRELRVMVGSGVESVRLSFYWAKAQPYASAAEVPPDQAARFQDEDGVPTTWEESDGLVRMLAARRVRILPVILAPPAWAARRPHDLFSPPRSAGEFARFSVALVRRYGRFGSFWLENPDVPFVPIRSWQIYNEPDLYWGNRRWPRGYVGLLKTTYQAIKRVDPAAKVVLAGLTGRSWAHLAALYRAHARRYFDIAAVHPYTRDPEGVIGILRLVRAEMRRFHDSGKKLWLTELGWPASSGRSTSVKYSFATTERGQADRLRRVLPMVARQRRALRLAGFFLYTWISTDRGPNPFSYAGLRRADSAGRVRAKPAYRAFRQAALRMEDCVQKGEAANRCARRARR